MFSYNNVCCLNTEQTNQKQIYSQRSDKMILLPDMPFDINGEIHMLSLQGPYTLDGKLIVSFEITEEPEYAYSYNGSVCLSGCVRAAQRTVKIMNEDSFAISIPYEYLANQVRDTVLQFWDENEVVGNVIRVGESPRYSWDIDRYYDESTYLRDLETYCINIRQSATYNYSYIEMCRNRLREQRRMPRGESEFGTRLGFLDENSLRCYDDDIGSRVLDRYWTISFDMSTPNANRTLYAPQLKKYIHQYNYKPEYIKHYMPDEDESTLLLGAEIEVDCGGESEEHAKNVLEIICGVDPENTKEALEDKMYCTHDGSLRNGIEFDTMPCTLEYHKNEMNYKEMFKYLDKHGYKAHDTDTCGLHVHANRSYLGKSELMQQLTISKILYILEKFNDEICVIARRNNRYSQFMGKGKDEKSVVELYGKYKSGINNKYVALNLQHDETIEFRCFKSTLKYETFILTLEFVKNIIDYAKSINIEEIEVIKWSDLMNTFSDELKEYYNTRLKKENKKEEKNSNSGSINHGTCTVRFAGGSMASNVYIDEAGYYDNYNVYNTCNAIRQLSNALSSSCIADCASAISAFTTELSRCREDTVESLKKEIESLKKKIRNCTNYMERTQLNSKLSEKQKELKKLKRNNRAI